MPNRRGGMPLLLIALVCIGGGLALLPRGIAPPPTTTNPTQAPPPHPEAITRAYRQRGEYRQALYHHERWVAREGWNADARQVSAALWREMGDFSRSVPYLEGVATADADLSTLRQLAEHALQTGAWGEAYHWMERMLVLAPQHRWATFQTGILLAPLYPDEARNRLGRITGDDDEAALAQTIMNAFDDPQVGAPASSTVGAILASAGYWAQAEHAFLQAAADFYLFPEAMAYVGLMRAYQGKDGAAWLEVALRNNQDDNPNIYFIEGLYYRVLDDFARSEAALIFAITLSPDNPAFYAELGNTYRLKGDLDEAAYWLEAAVGLSGNDANLRTLLDQFYETEAYLLPPELVALLRPDTFQADPSLALTASGWALHLAGESAAGLRALEEALVLNPQNIRAQYDKARILLETGRPAEARPLLAAIATGTTIYARDAARLLERLD